MSPTDRTDMGLGSRSDLDALSRSGRGKLIALGVLLAVALGAAAWSFLRKAGHGNPEKPTKVLIVARGTTVGFSAVLRDGGFEAAEGTLSAWENKARDELEELEEEGVSAVLRLADEFGYGYVAFEGPQELSWEEIDVEGGVPDFPEHVRFAVVSVGDFAFPHVMTLNPEPSPIVRDPGLVLLQALFEQGRLQQLLPDNDNPSIEDIRLRDRLQESLDRLAMLPEAERMADEIVARIRRQLVEEERAEPAPELLGEPLESANPIPLANGRLLTIARSFQLVTRDAVRADLDFEDTERFLFGAPGDVPDARRPCDSLMGGTISVHDSGRYGSAVDGSALLIKSLSEGLVLWTLDRDHADCGFTRVGEVPDPAPGVSDGGIPHGSGKVARTGTSGGLGVLDVVEAGSGERLTLGMLDGVELSSPTWIDEHTLAAVGASYRGEPDGLFLLSTEAPMKVLRIDATVFQNAGELAEIAAVPGGERLVVTAGSFPRKLFRLDLPADVGSLFAAPPVAVDREPIHREGLPTLFELDPNAMRATALTQQGRVHDPVVSKDARWAAVSLSDSALDRPDVSDDDEIALIALDEGAKMRLLTRNALEDHSPRFTADSGSVVFETRVEIPKTKWVITAPRLARVE